MNDEMTKRIEELCKDEEYLKYLFSLESAEKMSEELEKKDICLTPEEIRKIGNLIRKKENGELSDEDLEEISGGFVVAIVSGLVVTGSVIMIIGLCHVKKHC